MNILSIDGGGIRGIIPAKILIEVEKQIKMKYGQDKTISDHFDIIAGTSTGGLITLGLLTPDDQGKPKYSPQDLLDVYTTWGDEIFDVSYWRKFISANGYIEEKFDNDDFKDVLNDIFGDKTLADLLKPCLVTAFNLRDYKADFFTRDDAVNDSQRNFKLKDVAYATSAAPTYFEPARIKSVGGSPNISKTLVDGGVFANNPAMCAYAEVRNQFGTTARDMKILSIGTGYEKKSISYKEAKDWGALKWVKPLVALMMSGASKTVDYQLKQIFDTVKEEGQYLRVNGMLRHADDDFVNATKDNMEKLIRDAEDIRAFNLTAIQHFI